MIGEAHSNSCANLTCLKILTKHLKVVLLHNLAGPMMDSKLYERILLFTFDTILSVLFGMLRMKMAMKWSIIMSIWEILVLEAMAKW
jgi:hypothetical protein